MSDTTSSILPIITLDQADLDYAPGETVGITISNVTEGGSVILWVAHVTAGDDGILGTWDDVLAYDLTGTFEPWTITDGGVGDLDGLVNGAIQTSWFVDQDAANQMFQLSATDTTSGGTATVKFTDTPPSSTPVPAGDTNGTGGLLISAEEVVDSTGTGKIYSFLQVQANGTEEAFNAYNPPELNSGSTANYNRPIKFSEIPVVTISGQTYLEFWVDLNENNNGINPQISLDQLRLYSSASGTIETLSTLTSTASKFYDLDSSGDTSILFNDWNTGSGEGDYIVRVPISASDLAAFQASNPYIYLYSKFGGVTGYESSGGFEEWYVEKQAFVPFDLSGTKYTDVDGDGVVDPEDTGLGGVKIYIDVNEDGNFDDGVDLYTTTASDGTWSFTDLGAGYAGKMIYEVLPDGYVQTLGAAGYQITGTSGADQTNLNFANFEEVSVSGYKWTDTDGDGQWDGTESGLAGWTIYLDDDGDFGNGVIATTTTDEDGYYAFENLGPGTYYVYEASQTNWLQTYDGSASFTAQSGVNVGGDSGAAEDFNFGNYHFIPGNDARTIGFWSQRSYLWDGDKDTRADNLVKSGVIEGNSYSKSKIGVGFNDDIIWALYGANKPTSLMVGDRDGDGVADAGENILYVDMDVARSIINSSDGTGSDPRTLMLKQAIGAQLNIYNGVNNLGEPWSSPDSTYQMAAGDMITEAVLWLKTYGDGLFSDGTITKNTGTGANANGDYNISGKKGTGFVDTLSFSTLNNVTLDKFDATDRFEFWSTKVDVDATDANVWSTGEGLKNILDAYNNNKLVSDGTFVGWNMSGSPETSVIIDPNNFASDGADAFWQVAKEAGLVGLFYG